MDNMPAVHLALHGQTYESIVHKKCRIEEVPAERCRTLLAERGATIDRAEVIDGLTKADRGMLVSVLVGQLGILTFTVHKQIQGCPKSAPLR